MMNDFMKNVQGLITKFQVIDHYYVLDVLRKHQFFSDVICVCNVGGHPYIFRPAGKSEKPREGGDRKKRNHHWVEEGFEI